MTISIILILSIWTVLSLCFFIKIFKDNKKIQKLNKKIEQEKEILNMLEIENIRREQDPSLVFISSVFAEEKVERMKAQHRIEKLEREKKYIIEQISIYKSIYKIFKK